VSIKRSTGLEVASLVADLASTSELRREAAVARLAVIGPRAVDRLLQVAANPDPPMARLGAIRALEGIVDARTIGPAIAWLSDSDIAVSTAAVDLLRRFLRSEHGTTILEQLTALVLDESRPDAVRVTALEALDEMPVRVIEPLRARLRSESNAALKQRVTVSSSRRDPLDELEEAASRGLPESPATLKELLMEASATVSLPTLHRLVTTIHEREDHERRADARAAWLAARATAHRALAERDSRVALYDLRETLERASGPLPVEFVAAIERIGDAACLDAIASAWASAPSTEEWWRQHLASAIKSIVVREGLTKRHPAVKRVVSKWPALGETLFGKNPRRGDHQRRSSKEQ
jgi:hypothetical protein